MKLDELKINPENPSTFEDNDLTALEQSIKDFPKMMELRQIIYDPKTKMILGGNKRLICLKKMGFKTIPDNWTKPADKLTKKEKKRFILADNITFGEFDIDKLDLHFPEFDLPELGLNLENLNIIDNKEIDVNEFSDKLVLKFELLKNEYLYIIDELEKIDNDKNKALLKLLKYE